MASNTLNPEWVKGYHDTYLRRRSIESVQVWEMHEGDKIVAWQVLASTGQRMYVMARVWGKENKDEALRIQLELVESL